MVRVAIAGKGGVGKTLVAAGLAMTFARSGLRTLAIDADPSPNLALMLGLDSDEAEAILPISRNEDLIRKKTATPYPGVYNLSFSVEDIVRRYSVPTPSGAYLLVLGTIDRMGGGCSCPANTVLKNLLHHIVTGPDDAVVLDMEAGVEHLGRGTAGNVDLFLVVSTPDSRALSAAGSIARIAKEGGIPRVMLAGNRVGNQKEEDLIRSFGQKNGIPVLGMIPSDPRVSDAGIAGESVLQLESSVALTSVRAMAMTILNEPGKGEKRGRQQDSDGT